MRTTLLQEENVISLLTCSVGDDGDLVSLWLRPRVADLRPEMLLHSAQKNFVWLYRHRRSVDEEIKLAYGCACLQQDLKAVDFGSNPKLQLLWTDSGLGVAVYANGEPWAFIDERNGRGYSKGVLDPGTGDLWDQNLFARLFESKP